MKTQIIHEDMHINFKPSYLSKTLVASQEIRNISGRNDFQEKAKNCYISSRLYTQFPR